VRRIAASATALCRQELRPNCRSEGVVRAVLAPVDDPRPSRRLVDQRIRNRIIEYFELAESYDAQLAYEKQVPFVYVPFELIEQWRDWVPEAPRSMDGDPGVFSAAELQAIEDFRAVWTAAAAAVGTDYPALRDVQSLPEWNQLRHHAEEASRVFRARGRLPEDREVESD
jgi:hypothetical protein